MGMIVVDGRTDIDKLRELLATTTECSELDFKETLDLSKKGDELNFVKDAVSMFNRYPGGYIIVGATNEGEPSEIVENIDWKQFDGARLTDKIRSYVDAPLTLISALHEIDGHRYCLICILSLNNGLPVPFAKLGQFKNGKGDFEVVFRPGDITRRDGAQNRPIEYLQWSEILARHDAVIREDESKRINGLVDKINLALGEKGETPPLVYGIDDATLATTLAVCFEQGEATKLERFVNQLSLEVAHSQNAIDNLAAVATGAISYGLEGIAWKAIDALYGYYLTLNHFGPHADDKLLGIAIAAYEIGAAMVLGSKWGMISPFVNRQSPGSTGYIYASWIRECQVIAINAGKFKNDTSTMLISAALEHVKRHSAIILEYDFKDDEPGKPGVLTEKEDSLLNLLCSFDFLYCLCVFVAGEGFAGAYPACIGYEQRRINSVVVKVFGQNDRTRRELLHGYSDEQIADGFRELYRIICNEAMDKSRYVWGTDTTGVIGSFLDANPPSKTQ